MKVGKIIKSSVVTTSFYGHLVAAHLVYSLAQWQIMKSEVNDQRDQTPRPSLPRIEPVGNP